MSVLSDIKSFVIAGIWGEDEEPPVEHQPFDFEKFENHQSDDYYEAEGSVLAGDSVYDSTYAHRGEDTSVFEGESAYDPRYEYFYAEGSVLDGDSVLDSAYSMRNASVIQGPSLSKSGESVSSASTEASRGVVAGTTEYFKRPAVLPSMASASPAKASPSPLKASPNKVTGPYQPRPDDPVDVAVAGFFAQNPQAYSMNRGFTRISPGHYLLHGREIIIEMPTRDLMTELMGDKGKLVVRDGPLTQPMADYMTNKDSTAEYSGSVFQCKNALQSIPQNCRMTFADTGAGYSRIEAMKVAKEQASTRERAAKMQSQGSFNHTELAGRYQKTIDMKLGKTRTPEKPMSFTRQSPASSPPSAMPAGFTSPGGGRRLDFGGAAANVRSPTSVTLAPATPQANRSPGSVQVPMRVVGA